MKEKKKKTNSNKIPEQNIQELWDSLKVVTYTKLQFQVRRKRMGQKEYLK